MKTIKKYNDFINEEFFFFGGEITPEYVESTFKRIIELLKRNGNVENETFNDKYLSLFYDNTYFQLSLVDRNDIVIVVEKNNITDILNQYPITELGKIVNTIISYNK